MCVCVCVCFYFWGYFKINKDLITQFNCVIFQIFIIIQIHKYMNENKSNKYTKQLSNQFIFLLGSLGIGTAKD